MFDKKMVGKVKYKILVVNDQKVIRETIRDFLTDYGCTVEDADNGMNAIEMLKQSSFDLIISGLQMPKMDGIALVKNVKAIEPDMHIIITTGFGTFETCVASIKAGAADYLNLPLDREKLKTSIEEALQAKLQ